MAIGVKSYSRCWRSVLKGIVQVLVRGLKDVLYIQETPIRPVPLTDDGVP